MKCRQVKDKLSAFQDGELSPRERERVSEHLERCPACRERYAEIEKVWQALEGLPEIPPDPDFFGQLIKKINEPYERPPLPGLSGVFQLFSSLAVCTLLIAGVLIGAFTGNMLVKSDLFPFMQNQAARSRAAIEVFSLKAFDPIPPGTLGDKYLRMASYGEEGRR
jgi:anti-sigma factor RsiW